MSPRCVHPTFSAMWSYSVSQEPHLVCKLLLAPHLCTPMDAPVLWRLADLLHWHAPKQGRPQAQARRPLTLTTKGRLCSVVKQRVRWSLAHWLGV